MNLIYLNALNKINGVGPKSLAKLLTHFGDAEIVWNIQAEELKRSGIGEALAEKISLERKTIDPNFEWEKLQKENIRILTLHDPAYPSLLKEIHNPPFVLYVKGEMDFNSTPMIAIVGSRQYSPYGMQVAEKLAVDLTNAGITIVSGMALGIDSIAHRSALASGGKTVAVLGNSLDEKNIYPRAHVNLSREIASNGALVSDYPVETIAGTQTFPARNRLIAGMTLGTLVIEAGEKSGTLITAGLALEYNREVFAVPGSIFSSSSFGTHDLIKKGARLVNSAQDILEEINWEHELKKEETKKIETNIPEEKIILEILSKNPVHIDNIVKLSKLNTSTVASTLAMMEINGWVKNVGGQNYILF